MNGNNCQVTDATYLPYTDDSVSDKNQQNNKRLDEGSQLIKFILVFFK